MKINYVPKVFAHRITQSDLDSKPELVAQELEVDQVYVLREVTDGDIEEYRMPKEAEGQWINNVVFADDSDEMKEDELFEAKVIAMKDGMNIRLELTFRQDEEKPSPIMLIGALSMAIEEVKASLAASRKKESDLPELVDYKLTEMDIEAMGTMNPGHNVGDVIKVPKQAAEMLIMNNTYATSLPKEEECDCGECEAKE